MKVLIVEPGKYPREADIEHTLEAEQAVVGGTIEAVYPWRDSACIVCNAWLYVMCSIIDISFRTS